MAQAEPIRSILIAGGGTAGWMAAAALGHYTRGLPVKITLIESSEISTVGVGEATLPTLRGFHAVLGIDELEFIKATRATFKLGIRFDDWRALGHSFFHPFSAYGATLGPADFFHYWTRARREGFDAPLEAFSYSAAMAAKGVFAQPSARPPAPFANYAYAFHFDAGLYAEFLKAYALSLGVERVDTKITRVELDAESGFIRAVHTENDLAHPADLFIDCTGFRALLLKDALGIGYDDWSQWLPADRAVAIPCERARDLTPYTISTAAKAGWRWRIPLQHRTGNGYVYASGFLDEETAITDLVSHLDGKPLATPNRIRFTTGRRKTFWHKNCLGLGLSTGFLEPLESTSIALIQSGISKLLSFFPDRDFNPHIIFEANDAYAQEVERIRDFIIFHYKATRRDDSELWRYCQNMSIPDTLERKIRLFRHQGSLLTLAHESFEKPSWETMFAGFDHLPEKLDPRVWALSHHDLIANLSKMRQSITTSVDELQPHVNFIERICRDSIGQ